MKIIDGKKSLLLRLLNTRGKQVDIVSAFASQTERVIEKMLSQNNNVLLIVGTINCFTDPNLIEYLIDRTRPNLNLYMDFRRQDSIHWKLYLISPATVIIGSPNFTSTGLSMKRDTCVEIESEELYSEYRRKVARLTSTDGVLSALNDPDFRARLDLYIEAHRRTQATHARSSSTGSLEEWLLDDRNQHVEVHFWDRDHTEDEKEEAARRVEEHEVDGKKPTLRDFFGTSTKNASRFSTGDVVLCASVRGGHADFYSFDWIVSKGHRSTIYTFRRKRNPRPFSISPKIKEGLRELLKFAADSGRHRLHRDELARLK